MEQAAEQAAVEEKLEAGAEQAPSEVIPEAAAEEVPREGAQVQARQVVIGAPSEEWHGKQMVKEEAG